MTRSILTALFSVVLTSCSVAWHRSTITLRSPTTEVECHVWVSEDNAMWGGMYYLFLDGVVWPLDGLVSLIHGVRAAFDEERSIDGGPLGLLAAVALPGMSAVQRRGDAEVVVGREVPDDVLATDEALTRWFQSRSPYHGKVEVLRREVRPEHHLTRENFVLDDEGWQLARTAHADSQLAVVDGLVLESSEGGRARGGRSILVERLAQPAPKSRILRPSRSIHVSPDARHGRAEARLGDLEPGSRVSMVLQSGYYQHFALVVGPARSGVAFDELLPEQRVHRELIGKPDSAVAQVDICGVTEPNGPGASQFEGICVVEIEVQFVSWNSAGWVPGSRHSVVWNTADRADLPTLNPPRVGSSRWIAVSRLNWWGSMLTPNPMLVVLE